jgi:hypothetical protein
MSKTVQVMLLRAGIPACRAMYGNTWRINIYGDGIKQFAIRIGFVAAAKNKRLIQRLYKQDRGKNVPVDPYKIRQARKDVVSAIGIKSYENALFRRYVSVRTAKAIGGVIGFDAAYHYDHVKAIEDTECPSMCVQVPDGHRFLQNGFPHGNSQGSEWPVVIFLVDGSRGAAMISNRNLVYTAISRASQLCVTVGREGVLRQMAVRTSLERRKTFLRELLTEGATP